MDYLTRNKISRLIVITSTLFLFSSCLLSNFGSKFLAPGRSLRSAVPQYPSSQKIEIEPTDLEQIIVDLPGEDYLQYYSRTDIAWTEDSIADVLFDYPEILADDNWSSDHVWEAHYRYMWSEWEKENLNLSLMLLYDLDSEGIGILNSSYGIEGIEPGGTLIITHVVDLSQAAQKTPDKASEEIVPPTITVSDIQSVATSSIAGDPTIWVFLPSGEIAQSDDHGKSWSKIFEPLDTGWGYITSAGPDVQFTKSKQGLFVKYDDIGAFPNLWYAESTTWHEVSLPEGSSSVAVAQDGSGRVIAVGANPKGKENAWILESPYGDWRSITCEIDNWTDIYLVEWFPEYGIVGINNEDTILHAGENYQWEIMGTHGSFLVRPGFWVAADDNIYIHGGMDKEFRWNGESWDVFENSFYETLGTLPGVADFGTGPGNNVYRSEDAGMTLDVVDVPDMPERVAVLGLAVSGDDIVYLVTEAGFYMSKDAGNTWVLLIQN